MSSQPSGYTLVDILLVEDNPGDIRLIEETVSDGSIANTLSIVCG